MKNLRTFLFLGLITLFSSTAFAQNPHPSKFHLETEHLEHRSEDNGGASIRRATIQNQDSNNTYSDDDDGSIFNLRDDWMDWYRKAVLYGGVF